MWQATKLQESLEHCQSSISLSCIICLSTPDGGTHDIQFLRHLNVTPLQHDHSIKSQHASSKALVLTAGSSHTLSTETTVLKNAPS